MKGLTMVIAVLTSVHALAQISAVADTVTIEQTHETTNSSSNSSNSSSDVSTEKKKTKWERVKEKMDKAKATVEETFNKAKATMEENVNKATATMSTAANVMSDKMDALIHDEQVLTANESNVMKDNVLSIMNNTLPGFVVKAMKPFVSILFTILPTAVWATVSVGKTTVDKWIKYFMYCFGMFIYLCWMCCACCCSTGYGACGAHKAVTRDIPVRQESLTYRPFHVSIFSFSSWAAILKNCCIFPLTYANMKYAEGGAKAKGFMNWLKFSIPALLMPCVILLLTPQLRTAYRLEHKITGARLCGGGEHLALFEDFICGIFCPICVLVQMNADNEASIGAMVGDAVVVYEEEPYEEEPRAPRRKSRAIQMRRHRRR